MAVRMVEISGDAGCEYGVWQKLHDFTSGADLSNHLKGASATYYGTAARAFLQQLTNDIAADRDEVITTLRNFRTQFIDTHVPGAADGQVISVGALFGLIAAAGEVATSYEITGWSEGEAMRGVGACFDNWVAERGGTKSFEDMKAIELIRTYIAQHGESRSQRLIDEGNGDEPTSDFRTDKRAGFKRKTDGIWEYMFLADAWKEVCGGRNATRVARVLAEKGFLLGVKLGESYSDSVSIKGYGRKRLYRVSVTILGGETDGD
jgi:uncharacterized protein (DUF927 family)